MHQKLIESYYQHRGMKMPNAEEAFLFLVSEMGELADALVSRHPGWERNNPNKERNVTLEIGDVYQMLLVTCLQLGIDPLEAMKEKWKSKGWTEGENRDEDFLQALRAFNIAAIEIEGVTLKVPQK
jgi:NTP pyrophosphatase (non-canonical NTP hydrolase)